MISRFTTFFIASTLVLGCGESHKFGDDADDDTQEDTPMDSAGETEDPVPDVPEDTTEDPTIDTVVDTDEDTAMDTVPDSEPDTTVDTVPDTVIDTAVDTAVDTHVDTGTDTGFDTVPDTAVDTHVDTGMDTTVDTWPDTSVDVPTDDGSIPGTDCTNPVDLTGLSTWSGDLGDYPNAWSGGSGCDSADGREIWFTVTVPPGDLLRVSEITSTDVVVHVLGSCTSASCDYSSDWDELFHHLNDGTTDETFIIVVESYYAGTTSTVVLDIESTRPAEGNTCDDAVDISTLRSWSGDYEDYGNIWVAPGGCGSADGPEVWFTATVAAGQIFDFSEITSTDVVIVWMDSCTATDCLEYSDFGESIAYYNDSVVDEELLFVVEAYFGGEDGDLHVEQGSRAPFAGSMCSEAIDISSVTTWSGDFSDFVNLWSPPSSCGSAGGTEVWFTATVPSGNTFTLEETSGTDVVIELLSSCSATSCTDYFDFTESFSWTNTGVAPATLVIVVESYYTSGGPIALAISNTP